MLRKNTDPSVTDSTSDYEDVSSKNSSKHSSCEIAAANYIKTIYEDSGIDSSPRPDKHQKTLSPDEFWGIWRECEKVGESNTSVHFSAHEEIFDKDKNPSAYMLSESGKRFILRKEVHALPEVEKHSSKNKAISKEKEKKSTRKKLFNKRVKSIEKEKKSESSQTAGLKKQTKTQKEEDGSKKNKKIKKLGSVSKDRSVKHGTAWTTCEELRPDQLKEKLAKLATKEKGDTLILCSNDFTWSSSMSPTSSNRSSDDLGAYPSAMFDGGMLLKDPLLIEEQEEKNIPKEEKVKVKPDSIVQKLKHLRNNLTNSLTKVKVAVRFQTSAHNSNETPSDGRPMNILERFNSGDSCTDDLSEHDAPSSNKGSFMGGELRRDGISEESFYSDNSARDVFSDYNVSSRDLLSGNESGSSTLTTPISTPRKVSVLETIKCVEEVKPNPGKAGRVLIQKLEAELSLRQAQEKRAYLSSLGKGMKDVSAYVETPKAPVLSQWSIFPKSKAAPKRVEEKGSINKVSFNI